MCRKRRSTAVIPNQYEPTPIIPTIFPPNEEPVSPITEGIKVRAIFNFQMNKSNVLKFSKGDILFVLSDLSGPWWFAKSSVTKQTGLIPRNYVVIIDGGPTSLEGWFDISRVEAEKKLIDCNYPPGTYIIRPCMDSQNVALSVRHCSDIQNVFKVKHYKIRSTDNEGYCISTKHLFPDIPRLLRYYTDKISGICCPLSMPFPVQHRPQMQFMELEVNRSSITMERKLGNGNFGDVWLAKLNNSIDVAVKLLKENTYDQQQRKLFLEEAKRLHQLHHRRIVEIIGICSEPPCSPMYIITELMEKGSLLQLLREDAGKTIFFSYMLIMMNQIADGMSYLETKNFIHRDLRAANILVSIDGSVKVADFGLARVIDDVYEAEKGSLFPVKWTPPEAGIFRRFSIKSDVWSFGVLMYEIVTYGGPLYIELQNRSILQEIEMGYRLPNPNGGKIICPPDLYNVMLSCWDAIPINRPSFYHLKDIFENFQIATEDMYVDDRLLSCSTMMH